MSKPLSKQSLLSIGLMSGTSMDGIDSALLETDGSLVIKELGHSFLAYNPLYKILLKAAELSVRKAKGDLKKAEESYYAVLKHYLEDELKKTDIAKTLQDLKNYLKGAELTLATVIQHSTLLHSEAVKQLLKKIGFLAKQIDVIGYHGQTLFHQPEQKISIIIGDGQVLANEMGIKVVNDFRSNDLAEGGKGAPFAPLYHLTLTQRDQKIPAAIVNCGGIANITLVLNENPEDLIAFDTGPGNGLIDRLVRQRTQGKEHMDTHGQYGKKGKVHEAILKKLFEHSIIKDHKNYFKLKPPKALDIGDLQLIPELDTLNLEDACRTLEAFTARSIVQSLDLIEAEIPHHWILAGGGWHNPVILQELREALLKKSTKPLSIMTANEANWNGQALEAQIFAYLAVRSLKNLPLSMPGTTGVIRPVSGGVMFCPL